MLTLSKLNVFVVIKWEMLEIIWHHVSGKPVNSPKVPTISKQHVGTQANSKFKFGNIVFMMLDSRDMLLGPGQRDKGFLKYELVKDFKQGKPCTLPYPALKAVLIFKSI